MLNFETFGDALDWRKSDRKQLRSGNHQQKQVARQLQSCRKSNRCRTDACRVCLREFRLWWVGEVVRILLTRSHWTRCSVIMKGLLVPYGHLSTLDLQAVVKQFAKAA
jgi:hypothetical protein